MTETQARAKIAYSEILQKKHPRLTKYFRVKLSEQREDLYRMLRIK